MLIERNLENTSLAVIAVDNVGKPSATVAVSFLADTPSLAPCQTDSDVSLFNTDCLYFVPVPVGIFARTLVRSAISQPRGNYIV